MMGFWLRQLRDPYTPLHEYAARRLARIGARAVEPVLAELANPNAKVQLAAVRTLGEIGDARAIGPLMQILADGRIEARVAAAAALGRIGHPDAAPLLAAKTGPGEAPELRVAAIRALGCIHAPESGAALLRAAGDPVEEFRRAAADALVSLGADGIAAVVEGLRSAGGRTAEALLDALGRLMAAAADAPDFAGHVGEVLRAAAGAPTAARLELIARIGRSRDPAVLAPLIDLTTGPDSGVRWAAVSALEASAPVWAASREAGPALDALAAGFRQLDAEAAAAAARVLGVAGRRDAASALFDAVRSGPAALRSEAARALDRIEPDWGSAEPARMLRASVTADLGDSDPDKRRAAADVLGSLGDDRAVQPLIRCLTDPVEAVRASARRGLDRIEPGWPHGPAARAQVSTFLEALASPDPALAAAAAETLGLIGAPESLAPLARLLGRAEPALRTAAVRALGRIGDPRAVPVLVRLVSDPAVGTGAVWALGAIADPSARRALMVLLRSGDAAVHAAAAAALGRSGDADAVDALIESARSGSVDAVRALGDTGEVFAADILLDCLPGWRGALADAGRATIARIVEANQSLRRERDDLWCTRCLVRAGEGTLRLGRLRRGKTVRCRACGRSGRLVRVRTVIGSLGGAPAAAGETGAIRIALWDDAARTARNADIDVLEIPSGAGIRYDEAVRALCAVMTADRSRDRDSLGRVSVVLIGRPPLSQASLRLLAECFGQVRRSD